MEKYSIKTSENNFRFLGTTTTISLKGSRVKRIIVDNNNKKALFKYERYKASEACSEKMSYEIAKELGYDCAKIELAKDENDVLGILNYFFVDDHSPNHMDAVAYLNRDHTNRSNYYTVSNIKKTLDSLDESLWIDFIKIMVFDALVGEQDRHEENWGITKLGDSKYKLSPLYDNGCNLLWQFKDEKFLEKFDSGIKKFDAFIKGSRTWIYKEDHKTRYKHFELIEYLNEKYPMYVQKELENLNKLSDGCIENIVCKIPNELLTNKHKNYIINYLKKRKDILLNIK